MKTRRKIRVNIPSLANVFTLTEKCFYLFCLVETGHQLRLKVVFDEVDHEVHDGLESET